MIVIRNHRYYLLALLTVAGALPWLYSCQGSHENKVPQEDVTIIPYPAKVLKRSGFIELESNFWVVADVSDTAMAKLGKYLVNELDQIPGALASIADIYSTRKLEQAITIEKVEDQNIPDQGYELVITSRNLKIKGNSEQGIFYGIQSILTLIRNQWKANLRTATLRKMVITDWPIYKYRVADFSALQDSIKIEKVAKALARNKINYLVISTNQEAHFDEILLNKNFISLIPQDEITGKKDAIEASELFKINEPKSDKVRNDGDTLMVVFQSQETIRIEQDLILTGQLAWSGSGKKDNAWLIEQLQKSSSN